MTRPLEFSHMDLVHWKRKEEAEEEEVSPSSQRHVCELEKNHTQNKETFEGKKHVTKLLDSLDTFEAE